MSLRDYRGSARSTYTTVALSPSDMIIQTEGLTGWPDGDPGPFFVVINRQKSNEEKVLCVSHNGSDLVVFPGDGSSTGRGADETAAQSHAVGSVVEHIITATDAREANLHVNDFNVHIQGGTDKPDPNDPGTILFPGQIYYETDTEILWIYGSDGQWHASTAHPKLEENLDMQNTYRVVNLVDPVDPQDAATKSWVESTAQNITAGDAALARDWAIKMDGLVNSEDYSSKYYAGESSTSATASAGSASASAGSAAASAASAVEAMGYASNAAEIWKDFEARYLGGHPSPPTVDGAGEQLQAGALYYNTVDQNMFVYDGAIWIAASSASVQSVSTYEYVAVAGQTAFSGVDANGVLMQFSPGNNQVFLNGVMMSPGEDYTETAGVVTLAAPAAAGDLLNVVAFTGFVVANHYTKSESDARYATKAELESVEALALLGL